METKKLSISAVLRRAWSMLLCPFEKYLWLFVTITIFCCGADVFGFIENGNYAYSIYVASAGVVTSYLITLFCTFIHFKGLRFAIIVVILFLLFVFLCVSGYSNIIMNTPLNNDFIAAILGTNMSEANEFIDTLNKRIIMFVCGVSLLVVIIFFIIQRINVQRVFSGILFCFLCVCAAFVCHNPSVIESSLFGYSKYFFVETIPDLKSYEKDIDLIIDKNYHQPNTILLVIGESHCRRNNSLYGYEKNTNPKLLSIKHGGNLMVFPCVLSPECTTVPTFKCIMNTYKPEYGDSVPWYTCPTLPFVMHKAGYKTIWLSNQSKKGLWDNLIGAYSDLCDESYFVGNQFAGTKNRNSYDGELLKIINQDESNEKSFFIIHLMGSHPGFNKRFPESFAHFKASDYAEYKESQRQTRADYDNSVLYTDYVVSEIFKMFSDKDCIGIYLSDHGLDLYDTRDDYAAHGVKENPASFAAATKIPFLVYTTDKYKSLHPEMMQRIEESVDRPFRTDSLIYRIMEIASCRFE